RPWSAALSDLRDRLERELGTGFNSVLANLYRDGRDAMGWHSDDEPELGPAPVIASVSLGATRRFVLKHRRKPDRKLALELPAGSLLVMAGATQRNYRHALPRTARPVGGRINLTFRSIGRTAGPGSCRSDVSRDAGSRSVVVIGRNSRSGHAERVDRWWCQPSVGRDLRRSYRAGP